MYYTMRRYFAGAVVESDVARERRRTPDAARARARRRGAMARGNARIACSDNRMQALHARSRRKTRWKRREWRTRARAFAGRGFVQTSSTPR